MVICIMTCAVVVGAALLVFSAFRHGGLPDDVPVRAKPMMTDYELYFLKRLDTAVERVGGLRVHSQVSMSAVMDVRGGVDREAARAVRNRFDRKTVDFVLADQASRVVLIVELDDRTHDVAKDRERDRITASAGHATLRIRGADARDPARIERLIRDAMNRRTG